MSIVVYNEIDINESVLKVLDSSILKILLKDQTTKKNIIWATDNYKKFNSSFTFDTPISVLSITGKYGDIIKPRVVKSLEEKQERSRDKGEVFTPSWICNQQNNLLNKGWFTIENPFNDEDLQNKTWHTKYEPIIFAENHSWKEYINQTSLEITCGEAPYLTSRYDTVSGCFIPVKERIGLLDRKLRVISENVKEKTEWFECAIQALKSTYGYEWQGDNLILARENILFTVIEHYDYYFGSDLSNEQMEHLSEIISWNIWQMDGLNFVVPNTCSKERKETDLFGTTTIQEVCPACSAKDKRNHYFEHNGIYCKIKDWTISETGKSIRFVDTLK